MRRKLPRERAATFLELPIVLQKSYDGVTQSVTLPGTKLLDPKQSGMKSVRRSTSGVRQRREAVDRAPGPREQAVIREGVCGTQGGEMHRRGPESERNAAVGYRCWAAAGPRTWVGFFFRSTSTTPLEARETRRTLRRSPKKRGTMFRDESGRVEPCWDRGTEKSAPPRLCASLRPTGAQRREHWDAESVGATVRWSRYRLMDRPRPLLPSPSCSIFLLRLPGTFHLISLQPLYPFSSLPTTAF